jgi:leader peptidase (prepilin peptidase)/N-methyltransferase
MPTALGYVVAFVLGSIAASFANVCIYRLPLRQSIVSPASRCTSCQRSLRPWHNLPIVSFVALRGRCAFCQARISWRYLVVESLGGLLYLLGYHQLGLTVHAFAYALLVTVLLIVSFIDLAHMIIPDAVTLPGIVVGIAISSLPSSIGFANAVAGACLGGGIFFLIVSVYPAGMGGGDVKLIAMIGAFVGWQAVLATIILGAFCGAVSGLTLILLGLKGRRDPVPFGPFLAIGGTAAMLWGEALLAWYGRWTLSF